MSGLGEIQDLALSSLRSGYDCNSSASSGQKRRRDGSPKQSTTSFLQAARNLVSRRSNTDVCWNCEAPGPEFCHVVARADPAVSSSRLSVEFLLTGEVRSYDQETHDHLWPDYRNAIVLCASCHKHSDRTSNTGWVILPTYLQYFIEWEEHDFAERQRAFKQNGRRIVRKFPSEEDYECHLRMKNILTGSDDGMCRGGLYNSYILEPMFSPIEMKALQKEGLKIPGSLPRGAKRWHGAPMAAINRGFVVMGAPWMKLPEKEWEELRTLQRLYTRELPELDVNGIRSDDRTGESVIEQPFDQGNAASEAASYQQDSNPPAAETAAMGSAGIAGAGPRTTKSETIPLSNDDIDSGVDVCSREEWKRKRGWMDSSARYGDQDLFSAPVAESCRHSKRQRQQRLEEELGIHQESWCFGPSSSSRDKIEEICWQEMRQGDPYIKSEGSLWTACTPIADVSNDKSKFKIYHQASPAVPDHELYCILRGSLSSAIMESYKVL